MTKMKVLVGFAMLAGIAVSATSIAVGQDAIAQRKELMKGDRRRGENIDEMVKGEKPYDAKAAGTAASTIAKNWLAFVKLFPDDSKSGGETTAAHRRSGRRGRTSRTRAHPCTKDAEAAWPRTSKGADVFKASFGEVAKNCKGCHDAYSLPKK